MASKYCAAVDGVLMDDQLEINICNLYKILNKPVEIVMLFMSGGGCGWRIGEDDGDWP